MTKIGSHLSLAKGFEKAGKDALSIDANTFAMFLRNPRGAGAKELNVDDVQKLENLLKENDFGKLVAHAPYTMNPCSKNPRVRELASEMMADDLSRMEYLPGNYYNFHPGSRMGQDYDKVIDMIADFLNSMIKEDQKTVVLLETMTNKGSEIGGTFEQLNDIIQRVEIKSKIGVCLDSCHMWDAGYDVKNGLEKVLDDFDKIIGVDYIKAMHINDSKNDLGANKDRHALIGEGYIGTEGIVGIMTNEILKDLPFVLETPTDLDGHKKEIHMLRDLIDSK